MFSDRIFPPVSGGKRGRGNVSRIFIAIVLTATRKQTQLRQATNLSGVDDRSFIPNQLGFEQATVTLQEYAVPKLEIQDSPATFVGLLRATAMRLEDM